jgi:signal peptidase I
MNKKIEGIKKFCKKFWFILWKDDSLKGWIFSIIFLFVFIKFIFFPVLGLVTGTALPLAIVESCSMHHTGNILSNYDDWWDKHETKYEPLGITKKDFQNGFSKFKKGFTKGDIIFLIKAKPEKLKVGNIIAFNSGTRNVPVIHRIVNIKEKDGELIFTTIGDNNAKSLTTSNNALGVNEKEIKSEQLVGKAAFRIVPYLGWGKLIFFEHLRPISERGLCQEN